MQVFAAPKHGSTLGLANISKKKGLVLAGPIYRCMWANRIAQNVFEIWGTRITNAISRNLGPPAKCARIAKLRANSHCDARAY